MKNRLKFKGFDYEDGRIVKVAYFEGYGFGDRMLEGHRFKATIADDGTMSVEPGDRDTDTYLDTLNKKQWLKKALIYAESQDLFDEKLNGGEQLVLVAADGTPPEPPRIAIPAGSGKFSDFVKANKKTR